MIIINENRRSWELKHSVKAISETEIEIDIDGVKETFDLSGFTEDEEYILTDSLLLPYNPVQLIIKSGSDFTVHVFYDDPYIREGFSDPFSRNSKSIIIKPTKDNNIILARSYQRDLISESFHNSFKNGKFISEAIGIEVDCRRDGDLNDLQNVEGMIADYDNLTDIKKHYKGVSETTSFPCTLEQLQALKIEMIRESTDNRYFKKSQLYALIDSKNTISEVKEIVW